MGKKRKMRNYSKNSSTVKRLKTVNLTVNVTVNLIENNSFISGLLVPSSPYLSYCGINLVKVSGSHFRLFRFKVGTCKS